MAKKVSIRATRDRVVLELVVYVDPLMTNDQLCDQVIARLDERGYRHDGGIKDAFTPTVKEREPGYKAPQR